MRESGKTSAFCPFFAYVYRLFALFRFIRNHLTNQFPSYKKRITSSQTATNLNHFYPVAEMRQGNKLPPCQYRLTGLVSEQPEIVARNMATPKSAQTKSKEQKSPCLKFLKVLKTSFKKFSSRVRGNAPRSSPVRTPSDRTCDPASPWTAPSQQDDRGGRR